MALPGTLRARLPAAYSGPRVLIVGTNPLKEKDPPTADEQELAEHEKENAAGLEPGGVKGKLVGFSKQSRLNLAKTLAQVSSPDPIFHLTLTYGPEYPDCREELDREKNALTQRLAAYGIYGVWRLEFQRPRNAPTEWSGMVPHWHLLIWLQQSRTRVDRWGRDEDLLERLRRWWERRTKNNDPQGFWVTHGEPGKAAWYMALHNMKMNQSPPFAVGRWWGVIDRDKFKSVRHLKKAASTLGDREIIWLKRLMRRATGCRGSMGAQGFSWFLPASEHVRVLTWAQMHVASGETTAEDVGGNPF